LDIGNWVLGIRLYLLRCSQFGASGVGILIYLFLAWRNRFFGKNFQAFFMTADTLGQLGRAKAITRFLAEKVFYAAVLSGMKADRYYPPTACKYRKRSFQSLKNIIFLTVNRNPQSLENSGGVMDSLPGIRWSEDFF
jgi:hypothetical protein